MARHRILQFSLMKNEEKRETEFWPICHLQFMGENHIISGVHKELFHNFCCRLKSMRQWGRDKTVQQI